MIMKRRRLRGLQMSRIYHDVYATSRMKGFCGLDREIFSWPDESGKERQMTAIMAQMKTN